MNSELRKSAGSDIKRLQEMVKRLEEQNAQLKNSDSTPGRRAPNNGKVMSEDNMVKVKLNLDDVPLLDLNSVVEEDEDTWLYVSPKHPPSAEQKKISPFKYLKDSLDVPDLNKVRGSLLAKLESIAAQEEALSRSPPHASVDGHRHHHSSYAAGSASQDNRSHKLSVQSNDDNGDADDDDVDIQVKPRRRVPLSTTASQDDSDLVVKGPLRRRGGPPQPVTGFQSPRQVNDDDDSEDDNNTITPVQRRVPAVPSFNTPSPEDSSLVVRGPLRRRGASPQPRALVDSYDDNNGSVPEERSQRRVPVAQDDEDLVVKGPLRRRGTSPQPRALVDAVSYMDDDDDNGIVSQERPQRRVPVSRDNEDLVVKGPLRRRGPGTPTPRQPVAASPVRRRGESPQPRASFDTGSYMDDNDDDDIPQERPQRRVPVSQDNEDLVVKGPLKRRGGTPKPRQPVAAGYGMVNNDEEYKDGQSRRRGSSPQSFYQEDYNSSLQRDELRSNNDVPIVTAVRRREPNQINQVKRREPARPRTAEDIEVRRRSMPQAPTHNRGLASPRQSGTPPQSPSPRKPTPRTGQLAAPRRVPTPRGVSPARSNDDYSWSDGFY